jgi:hypothetical protein
MNVAGLAAENVGIDSGGDEGFISLGLGELGLRWHLEGMKRHLRIVTDLRWTYLGS